MANDVSTAVGNVDGAALGGSVAAHDMSMLGLFLQADSIVKIVMLMLIFASVWCWSIIITKRSRLNALNKRADRFEDAFWSGEPLDTLYERVKSRSGDPLLSTFTAGMEEWQSGVSSGIPSSVSLRASLKQRVERAMGLAINREMQLLERGMTFLASVGSTAPFIGLFGTVWGIMNSFSAIAATKDTSLAVVAPGIAEALFATALGLVAAIPAVIAFNVFSTNLNRYGDRLDAFTTEFIAILSRHLDQSEAGHKSSSMTTSATAEQAA
ncbi:MAG: protein TolQ [Pseudomonadota bacterium]|jgi:biopolymer transport protein TolQ|nr:protein TolQ [Alphaproteobacteria bacterium]MEC7702825.1 protein TolQ [Pseudomonadota bacterium]MCS5596010.1 protein TolQ [Alphaproteobacteria bacterium]MEC9235279.1 protein TolQ [Pseudomonadota bacterium]MED5422550.1 protein TolQ [Pseudomonadota bacterium]|tara:strand:- start:812 stop:1615 length:804 start_codon:yes stop_codon:yes gene_type:complete